MKTDLNRSRTARLDIYIPIIIAVLVALGYFGTREGGEETLGGDDEQVGGCVGGQTAVVCRSEFCRDDAMDLVHVYELGHATFGLAEDHHRTVSSMIRLILSERPATLGKISLNALRCCADCGS